jgi:hypothetical protein
MDEREEKKQKATSMNLTGKLLNTLCPHSSRFDSVFRALLDWFAIFYLTRSCLE